MTAFRTPGQIADRTERATRAAVEAARDLGLDVSGATVLYEVFSVVVRLAPAPVVARVPTVLPPHASPELVSARQQRELDVAGWLGDQGHPVIRPSPLVPRQPLRRNGFSLTLWEFVEHVDAGGWQDFVRTSRVTAEMHAALRGYPGELPFLGCVDPTVPQVAEVLAARPDLLAPEDLDRARREWEILAPVLSTRDGFEREFPGIGIQPIHGDSPPFNIVATPRGDLYADFEMVSSGPAEWDLTMAGTECVAAYEEVARRHGLRALDRRLLRVLESARMLQLVGCLALAPELPVLVEGLRRTVDQWRATPMAGGLAS